jgi:pimeloyl-ACP methyl ester carboxylesterase
MKDKLILLHGALASQAQFDKLVPLLKDRCDPQTFNFSGHGGSFMSTGGYTFPAFADDILRHLDAQKIEKADLFGYSMGGYAALFFATRHPERVNRIFTLNVKFRWDAGSTQKEIAMLNAENMLLKVPSFANNLMLVHGMNMWKQVLENTAGMMESLTKEHFLTVDNYRSFTFPLLLAVGDRDTTSGIAQTIEVYEQVKGANMLVLPATPHPFEKVDAEVLGMHLKKFFSV